MADSTSGKGSTTSTTAPSPQAAASYSGLMSRANRLSMTPYEAYGGELVAGLTPAQLAGFGQLQSAYGSQLPYMTAAQRYATEGASQLQPEDWERYQNPYQDQVVRATMSELQAMQGVSSAQALSPMVGSGGLFNDRMGVAQGQMADANNRINAQTIANLNMSGWDKAIAAAQADRAAAAQGAYTFGNLGAENMQAILQGAGATMAAGNQQQQQQQAIDTSLKNAWDTARAFPYQQIAWATGVDTGLGSGMGGTSTTTPPAPNAYAPYIGAGLAGASMFAPGQKTANSGGRMLPAFDDGGTVPGMDPSTGPAPMPYAGAKGYIPTIQPTRGPGPPKPPSVGDQGKGQGNNPLSALGLPGGKEGMSELKGAASGLGNLFEGGIEGFGEAFPEAAAGAADMLPLMMLARGGAVDLPRFDEGGAVQVRGPQTFGERFNDWMNDRGLPGSLDLSDWEAHPVGVAALGRAMFGSSPNERVRRGFDAINKRTVHGYQEGGGIDDAADLPPYDAPNEAQEARDAAALRLSHGVKPPQGRQDSGELGEAMLSGLVPGYGAFREGDYGRAGLEVAAQGVMPFIPPPVRRAGIAATIGGMGVLNPMTSDRAQAEDLTWMTPQQQSAYKAIRGRDVPETRKLRGAFVAEQLKVAQDREDALRDQKAKADLARQQAETAAAADQAKIAAEAQAAERKLQSMREDEAIRKEQERQSRLQAEKDTEEARVAKSRAPFRERLPEYALPIQAASIGLAGAVPFGMSVQRNVAYRAAARDLSNALERGNKAAAIQAANRLTAFEKTPGVAKKVGKAAGAVTLGTLPFEGGTVIPNAWDHYALTEDNPNRAAADEELNPLHAPFWKNLGVGVAEGVPLSVSAKKFADVVRRPPVEQAAGDLATFAAKGNRGWKRQEPAKPRTSRAAPAPTPEAIPVVPPVPAAPPAAPKRSRGKKATPGAGQEADIGHASGGRTFGSPGVTLFRDDGGRNTTSDDLAYGGPEPDPEAFSGERFMGNPMGGAVRGDREPVSFESRWPSTAEHLKADEPLPQPRGQASPAFREGSPDDFNPYTPFPGGGDEDEPANSPERPGGHPNGGFDTAYNEEVPIPRPRPQMEEEELPAKAALAQGNTGGSDAWRNALMAAGFGLMANRSPYLGQALGEAGLAGMGSYSATKKTEEAQRKEHVTEALKREELDARVKRLDQAHRDIDRRQTETERANAAREAHQRELLQQGKTPPGMRMGAEGKLEAVPGYLEALEAQEKAKAGAKAPAVDEAANEIGARQIIEGDLTPFRGARTTAQLSPLRAKVADILEHEYGMSRQQAAEYLARKQQEYRAAGIGAGAAARTAGVREENLNLILKVTDAAVPKALEKSEAVWRTGAPSLNKLIQHGQLAAGIEDKNLALFAMANLQLAEGWAKSMNPTGVMRESDRDLALNLLSTARSKETYKALVLQLQEQIKRERDSIRGGGAGPSAHGPERAATEAHNAAVVSGLTGGGGGGAAPPQSGGTPIRRRQDGYIFEKQPDGSWKDMGPG